MTWPGDLGSRGTGLSNVASFVGGRGDIAGDKEAKDLSATADILLTLVVL